MLAQAAFAYQTISRAQWKKSKDQRVQNTTKISIKIHIEFRVSVASCSRLIVKIYEYFAIEEYVITQDLDAVERYFEIIDGELREHEYS